MAIKKEFFAGKYQEEAKEFLTDKNQIDCTLGFILDELSNGGEHFVDAIRNLSVNDIAEAVLAKDLDKWSKRILELRETLQIKQICPDAKIILNTYEEIKFSLLEIADSHIIQLTTMFEDYSIKITVESSSLLVRIIRDKESL